MNTPPISLIIPMYNAEKFIAECLDSAIKQTYKNLEIIIVDDNSTDASAEIVHTYAKNHENVIYIKTKNRNASKTRRDGISKTKADLVCFVDSDDILDEKYIERLYEAMRVTETTISACNIETFTGELKPAKIPVKTAPYVMNSNADSFVDHYHITDVNKLTLQTLPGKLFKKDLFKDIDYSVLVTNIFEDNFIMVQILRKVKKLGVVDEVLYWYRQNTGTVSDNTVTTTVSYRNKKLNSIEFFRDVVMEYCRKMLGGPNVDAAIDRLCAVEFFNYARMVPDLLTHNQYLEQRVELDGRRLEGKDAEIKQILNSETYKLGNKVYKMVNVFKNRK